MAALFIRKVRSVNNELNISKYIPNESFKMGMVETPISMNTNQFLKMVVELFTNFF
jgi:hypothetical protein